MTPSHRARPGRSLTLTVSFRIFMLAVIAFATVSGWVLFLLIDANASLDHYVKTAHAQRLINQADTQKQIRDLACLVVKPYPNSAGPLIKDLREQYKCPPYDPKAEPSGSKSAVPPGAAGPPKPRTATPTGIGVVIAARHGDPTHGDPTHGVTRTVHAPRPSTPHPTPTPTRSTTKSTPSATPPIVNLGGRTCAVGLLGICVLAG